MQDPIRVEYKKVKQDALLPTKSRDTDAGYDIYSVVDCDLPPHSTTNVETGIIITFPVGFFIQIAGRSGLFRKSIAPLGGVIDPTYTGELIVTLTNRSNEVYRVKKHDRIAQFLIHRVFNCNFVEVEEFSPEYNVRGTNGFGSSGR